MGWVLEAIRYLCSSCNFPLRTRGSNFGTFLRETVRFGLPPSIFFYEKVSTRGLFFKHKVYGMGPRSYQISVFELQLPTENEGLKLWIFLPPYQGKKIFSKSKKKKSKIVVLTQFLIFSPQIDMKILPNTYIIHPACHTTFLKKKNFFFFFSTPTPLGRGCFWVVFRGDLFEFWSKLQTWGV